MVQTILTSNLTWCRNLSFGVIIRVENEAFQVLKGVPDRPKVVLVKLREIKCKIEKKISVQVRFKNTISSKDVMRIVDGTCIGKQGPVKHIYGEYCSSLIAIILNMQALYVLRPNHV